VLTALKAKIDPRQSTPLTLAYLGDAVYELWVRTYLIAKGETNLNQAHRLAVELVNARTQAVLSHQIASWLNEEELEYLRRGRNAKSHVPKSAAMIEYRQSTGLECLVGYWYLTDQNARLERLFTELLALEGVNTNEGRTD